MWYVLTDIDNVERIFKTIYIDNIKTPYIISSIGTVINTKSDFVLKWNRSKTSRYWDVRLKHPKELKFKAYKVHRLVALYFIYNDNPINKTQVNHLNGDRDNNSVSNLEWCTPSENCIHAVRIGLKPDVQISESMAREICKLLESRKFTNKEISEMVGCKKGIIDDIRARNSWTFISKDYDIPKVRHFKKYDKYISDIDNLIRSGYDVKNIIKELNINNSKGLKRFIQSRMNILKEANII